MKKSGTTLTMVLLVLLLAVGVLAVLAVHYPELQEKIATGLSDFGKNLHEFFEPCFERIKQVFVKG